MDFDDFSWIGDISGQRAQLTPNHIAIEDEIQNEVYTFENMNFRANRVARMLLEKGISKGDRIVLLSKIRIECIDLFFAVNKIGGIFVPLNSHMSVKEITELLGRIGPSVVVYEPDVVNKVREIKQYSDCEHYIVFGYQSLDEDLSLSMSMSSFSGLDIKRPDVSIEDTYAIFFPNQTDKHKNGIELSHKQLFWNAINTSICWDLRTEDKQLSILPYFTQEWWNTLFIPSYYQGSSTVLMNEFDPERILKVVKEKKCTIVVSKSQILSKISESQSFNYPKMEQIRFFVSNSPTESNEILKKYSKHELVLKINYTLDEIGPNNFYVPEDLNSENLTTIGIPLMHCDAKIVDPKTSKPVSGREIIGELYLKGPHSFKGYWKNPDATKEIIISNGWIKTGDLAKQDENGLYFLVKKSN
ncbi:MAG: AMP-binding protein [Candidatus Hodarchaeales archaeon]|jgi:fatty-acyl-CoA synthase